MDESTTKEIYFNLNIITPPGSSPNIESGDTLVAGTDDRLDIHDLATTGEGGLHRKLAAATVILTQISKVADNNDGTWTLSVDDFMQGALPPCSNEKFKNQKTGGWCSGFLVDSDVIVTAGHCGESLGDIVNTAYIFGFQVANAGDTGTTMFNDNQVYFGKELIAHDLSPSGDFAIVRLDRAVTAPSAQPLTLRSSVPSLGSNLGVIGYPSGLPVKVAFGDATILMKHDDPWLVANLDTYGGNSGSAVFDADGEVVGILVRGAQDYVDGGGCFRTRFIEDSQGSEAITKTSVFKDKIP